MQLRTDDHCRPTDYTILRSTPGQIPIDRMDSIVYHVAWRSGQQARRPKPYLDHHPSARSAGYPAGGDLPRALQISSVLLTAMSCFPLGSKTSIHGDTFLHQTQHRRFCDLVVRTTSRCEQVATPCSNKVPGLSESTYMPADGVVQDLVCQELYEGITPTQTKRTVEKV